MWFPVPVPICRRYLAGTETGTRGRGASCLAFVRDEHHHLVVRVVVFLHRGVALTHRAETAAALCELAIYLRAHPDTSYCWPVRVRRRTEAVPKAP